ncbi:hypothetical protein Tco_0863836 [Tanacetum coccineum]
MLDCSSTLLLPGPVTTEEKASEDCKSAGYLGNKPDLDTISFDDFYNNFKIVEQEVKGTTSSSSSSQNMAFVSSLSSTNEVNTAYGVSTANTQVSPDSTQDLEQIHEDDIEEMDLKWQLALLSMRTRRWDTLQGNAEDLRTKIARTEIKTTLEGLYMADDEVPTNIALMAFSDSERISNSPRGPKTSKSVSEDISNEIRESPDAPLVEELVSDDKLEQKTIFPTVAKIEFIRSKQQEKLVRKPVKYAEMYRSQSPKVN